MTIGHRIKIARERKDMTLDEVAKLCNTTKQTIFKYENEIVTNIPYDKIVLLSNALDVSPSYLFGWDEKEKPTTQADDGLSEEKRELIERIKKLPEDKVLVLLQVARSIK
jgi:transcriptional regulator with XRE-family HTH domain